ncbi:MAG: hypothetical protein KBG75_00765 [Pseudomonadales bacterium]|nr:hypothetical protein [Pseudomonadales bacterium]
MSDSNRQWHRCALLASVLCFTSGITNAGVTDMKQGQGGTAIQGSAGTTSSQGDSGLAHCPQPMGAIAVVEPQDYMMAALSSYSLQSPVSLIRMMIQQSNCFIVVERGQGMQNMMQERALADSGQLRNSSNVGAGQMVAADFVLTPTVVFSDNNAGGVGGALGGAIGGMFGGRTGSVIGGMAGGLKFKEAQTSMLVTDARSGVQVAAAEGSAKKADLALGGFMFGHGNTGSLGGYQSTAEGKVIAASLVDNYNNIVQVVSGDPNLQRNVGSLAKEAAAGGSNTAGVGANEGDVIYPKINNVKLLAQPSDSAKVLATLAKSDELVYMGEERSGYLKVEGSMGGGWIKKALTTR